MPPSLSRPFLRKADFLLSDQNQDNHHHVANNAQYGGVYCPMTAPAKGDRKTYEQAVWDMLMHAVKASILCRNHYCGGPSHGSWRVNLHISWYTAHARQILAIMESKRCSLALANVVPVSDPLIDACWGTEFAEIPFEILFTARS